MLYSCTLFQRASECTLLCNQGETFVGGTYIRYQHAIAYPYLPPPPPHILLDTDGTMSGWGDTVVVDPITSTKKHCEPLSKKSSKGRP